MACSMIYIFDSIPFLTPIILKAPHGPEWNMNGAALESDNLYFLLDMQLPANHFPLSALFIYLLNEKNNATFL